MRRSLCTLLSPALLLVACGGDAEAPSAEPADIVSSSVAAAPPTPGDTATASVATSDIEGEVSLFVPGGSGAVDLDLSVDGRVCTPTEPLPLSCRASQGAGGGFAVTAEGVPDAPGDFNVVVRCGLDPAVPAASASGPIQPVTTDLGLAPYGEVAGVTLLRDGTAEAALVYLPEGAACPVVWSLGPVDPRSLFTGGTDALNGSEAPIRFRDATGAEACAISDGSGGISVGIPDGEDCG